MPENVIESLLEKRLELEAEKKRIEESLEDVTQQLRTYLLKNGLDKVETAHYKISLRDSQKLVWIDEEAGKKFLMREGLLSRFINESFNSAGLKKYIVEHPDFDAGGNLEVSSDKTVSITAKKG